jgi:RNA polymerase sigma factor (sigma-70 family)
MGLHGRSPLLRLQSDERLIALVRRGNSTAFEVLVSRYQSRLLAFCRHLLGSREDAEDVLQEALAAAFNAILADDRTINVRPWLYRIARNRCLNHLRRIQAVGVDSMDVHLSEHGTSTADKVHRLEEFRMLVGDIQELPETQKTALVLREMDALSYEQIAEAMETTVPSVKSLLVRARVSLAEAAEARMLTCDEVRVELAETAEGLRKKISPVVRRHLRSCERCSVFQVQLKETSKALTALLPIGPLVLLKQLFFAHLGHSAGSAAGSSATGAGAAGAGAAGQAAAVGSTAVAGSAALGSAGSMISFGVGTIATKAAAGLAAAALVTAGAVDFSHGSRSRHPATVAGAGSVAAAPVLPARGTAYHATAGLTQVGYTTSATHLKKHHHHHAVKPATDKQTTKAATTATTTSLHTTTKPAAKPGTVKDANKPATSGRTQSQTQTTVLGSGQTGSTGTTTSTPSAYDQSSGSSGTTSTGQSGTSTTTTSSSPSGGSGTNTTGSGSGTTTGGGGTTTDPGSESDPGTTTNPDTGGAGAGPGLGLAFPPQ